MAQALIERTDEQLMARLGAGDRSAMRALVERHHRALLNFFLRYTNEPALAEDLTQETMLRVLKSAPVYQPLAPFSVWLYRIAKNLCFNELGSRRVRARRLEAGHAVHRSPEDDVVQAEHEARVRWAVRQLPERQRLALVLRRFEGLQVSEIAEVMETSATAVEGLLGRASASLRSSLHSLLDRHHMGQRARKGKR